MAAKESAYWQQHSAALLAFGEIGERLGKPDWTEWCRLYPGVTPAGAALKYGRLKRSQGLPGGSAVPPPLPPEDPVEAEQRRQDAARGRRQELAELLSLVGCATPTEALPYDPPRITVEQSGEMTIYTDSLVGAVCYRVGGSLSCVNALVDVEDDSGNGYDE